MDWLATITQGIAELCPMCPGGQDAVFAEPAQGMGLRASCVVANHKSGISSRTPMPRKPILVRRAPKALLFVQQVVYLLNETTLGLQSRLLF
jgi:hypothetical protein